MTDAVHLAGTCDFPCPRPIGEAPSCEATPTPARSSALLRCFAITLHNYDHFSAFRRTLSRTGFALPAAMGNGEKNFQTLESLRGGTSIPWKPGGAARPETLPANRESMPGRDRQGLETAGVRGLRAVVGGVQGRPAIRSASCRGTSRPAASFLIAHRKSAFPPLLLSQSSPMFFFSWSCSIRCSPLNSTIRTRPSSSSAANLQIRQLEPGRQPTDRVADHLAPGAADARDPAHAVLEFAVGRGERAQEVLPPRPQIVPDVVPAPACGSGSRGSGPA